MLQSLRKSACKPHSKFMGVPPPSPPPLPPQGFSDTCKALQQSWLTPSLMESFQALSMSYNSQLSTVWCKFILGRPLLLHATQAGAYSLFMCVLCGNNAKGPKREGRVRRARGDTHLFHCLSPATAFLINSWIINTQTQKELLNSV